MQNVIKVEALTKAYGKLLAADGISLTVERGMIFGLLGANGAGKSTVIECILGTKKSDKGWVSILGMDPQAARKMLYERVGVQFQEANYQEKITVAELCKVTAALYQNAADPFALLSQFGIGDQQKKPVKDLSGGQRQRLFIVLSLIPDPEVVFLDELTTGLDPRARREVWKILSTLKEKGLTIFLTSHFMDEVEALCERICILKHGKTVFYGTVTEAIQNSPYHTFEETYLWYTHEEEEDDNESL